MVCCMKTKQRQDLNIHDNFYLGPPDFNKFTPGQISKFPSKRNLWLFSNRLLQQSQIYSLQKYYSRNAKGIEGSCARSSDIGYGGNIISSSPQEKKEIFRKTLAQILSCIYAVFIVTLGIVIYIGELISGNTPIAEVFSIYLLVTGIAYLLFLYSDMRKFSKILKISEEMKAPQNVSSEAGSIENSLGVGSIEWNSLSEPDLVLPHHYCFRKGRHIGSFYLKLGAAGFCLGHLLHSGLLISYQVIFLLAEPFIFYKCANITTLVLDIMYPTYSFLQLFFIFKYSHVIINKHKVLARFAIMHCIGANVCFWIWTIIRETVDLLSQKKWDLPTSLHHIRTPHGVTYNNTSGTISSETCQGPNQFSKILGMFTPYLYPFTIEYSILVAGVMFIIWQHIGAYTECTPSSSHTDLISNVVLHANCQSSNKGLFAGLIVLVGSFLSIILFFVAMADRKYMESGLLVNAVTELIITLLMTATVIPAYRQIIKLDVNMRSNSLLDDLLLFICIPAFFVQAILSVVPSWNSQKYVNLANVMLQVIQVLIQTPFITDGLRRCSNSKRLQAEKPGRELLMFLIVCNVTMWITETFEIRSHSDTHDPRSAYYGAFVWSTITHLTFPLTMFYRFHSSVCIVNIWKSAYSKEQYHF